MLKKIQKNNIKIDITDIKFVEKEYKKRKFKTLLINNEFYLNQRDYIIFICDRCNKEVKEKFAFNDKFFRQKQLCRECSFIKTKTEKYGTANGISVIKNAIQEKYGVENVSQLQSVKDKVQETMLINYGIQTNLLRSEIQKKAMDKLKTPEIINKKNKTINEKYGVENISQSKEIKDKKKQTMIKNYGTHKSFLLSQSKQTINEKYGVENISQSKEIKDKKKIKTLKKTYKKYLNLNEIFPLFTLEEYLEKENKYDKFLWHCNECNTEFEGYYANGIIPRCPICYPTLRGYSNIEKEIVNYVKSLNINIIENDRKLLQGKELDIYLPDYDLAIEFNGLYWHSELQGKDKNYHLNKTLECEKLDIQVLHIFEDEWINKQNIIKSIIKGKLGLNEKIYARKCELKEIDNQQEFLDNNHLQGYIPAKINIGLYYNDELTSLLTFSKPRFNKNYDWEMIRFVNKIGYSVIGGFSKLLKYFLNNYQGSIITYSDIRLFDGKVYETNGFTQIESSKPSYYYTDYKNRYSRQKFQKHKIPNILESFNSNLTEWENMQMNGWDRIWDCGNYVYIKNDSNK